MCMRILFLSAYDTPSHSNWCRGLIQNLPEFDWTYLSLPPRHFPWRIKGNPINWYFTQNSELNNTYHVLLATSMVDLATLYGLYPNLSKTLKILYFHENQFAYPLSKSPKRGTVEPRMVNIYAALAADRVVFNSEYNLNTFLSGARELLRQMPIFSPPHIVDAVKDKSGVLPVPVGFSESEKFETSRIPNSLIWNHRWEHDKNPADFFHACSLLKSWDIPFRLIVMGQQFRQQPQEFDFARNEFAALILCWGEQEYESYCNWLCRGEWAVSTARHEFQGVALMEAVQLGNIPVVPDRLSYPEYFARDYRFRQTGEDLAYFLKKHPYLRDLSAPNLEEFSWEALTPRYRKLLDSTE